MNALPPDRSRPAAATAAPPLAAAALPDAAGEQAAASERAAAAAALPDAAELLESEQLPAWLVSLVLHTLLLILLMLWQAASKPGTPQLQVTFSAEPAAERSAPEPLLLLSEPPGAASPSAEQAEAAAPAEPLAPIAAAAAEPPPLPVAALSPLGETPAEPRLPGGDLTALLSAAAAPPGRDFQLTLPSVGIAPRTAASRAELGARYGATPESENAVELALAWLAEHQQRDGSWSFDLTLDPCRGRCSHSRAAGDSATPATAGTGLALLAFLGAGHTHREGDYTETVRRGIYYLRDAARPSQFGLDLQAGSMYGHGIATLALTEVLAIDRYHGEVDSDLQELVEGLILFTIVAQHSQGGWRYVPGSPGDMTVTGWQILSLVSARYGGIPLRTTTLSDAKAFVMSLSEEGSYAFGYTSRRPQRNSTAIGLCMLMYLGQSPQYTPYMHALDQLAAKGPKFTDLYHDYYATLALHNARHHAWEAWHRPLRDHLVRTQATRGHERGSWHFKDIHGDVGGRLYSTAMAAMILEVYYRHLPLYQDRDAFELR